MTSSASAPGRPLCASATRCPKVRKCSSFCSTWDESRTLILVSACSGDPSIELPKLDPITIPAMEVNKNAGSVLNVNMTFKDLKVSQTARDVVLKSVK